MERGREGRKEGERERERQSQRHSKTNKNKDRKTKGQRYRENIYLNRIGLTWHELNGCPERQSVIKQDFQVQSKICLISDSL